MIRPLGSIKPLTCCDINYANNRVLSVIAFYEKVIKVKADVAAFLINCLPSA